jgi:hypothetical protein
LEDKYCTNYAEEANIPIRKKPNCFFDVMYDGMRSKTGFGQNSSQGFLTAWVEDMFGIGIGIASGEGRETFMGRIIWDLGILFAQFLNDTK